MSTFTTRKSLSRRTLLRGVGATLSLPFLDAMVPAAAAASRTVKPAKRLSYVFIPMGCDQSRWMPGSKDTLDKLSPILKSLDSVKQHCTVVPISNSSPRILAHTPPPMRASSVRPV